MRFGVIALALALVAAVSGCSHHATTSSPPATPRTIECKTATNTTTVTFTLSSGTQPITVGNCTVTADTVIVHCPNGELQQLLPALGSSSSQGGVIISSESPSSTPIGSVNVERDGTVRARCGR